MVTLLEARGGDADDAGVPARGADHDSGVARGIERARELRLGLLEDVFLDGAAFAVLRVEAGGDGVGAHGVVGEEQLQRVLRGAEAAGGVQARAEAEADIRRTERRAQSAHFDERAQPDPARLRELEEPAFHERPVFLHEWHEVGHGAARHVVEMRAQLEVRERAAFEQGMGGFENEAHAAEVVKVRAELGIDHQHQRLAPVTMAAFPLMPRSMPISSGFSGGCCQAAAS